MSDIVDRLAYRARSGINCLCGNAVCDEAAREITALRARVAELEGALVEIVKPRGVIWTPETNTDTGWRLHFNALQDLARAALKTGGAKMFFIIAFVAAAVVAAASTPADAARCPQGYIYRPSQDVCQLKQSYAKQTRVRYAKASIKHRVKKERSIKRAKSALKNSNQAPLGLTPGGPTPMWYFMEPDPFKHPYGRLVVMNNNYDPTLAAWANQQMWGEK